MKKELRNQPRLKYEDVITMRALHVYKPDVFSGSRLGRMFDVTRCHAQKVVRGYTWKNIPFPSDEDAAIIAKGYLEDY